MNKTLKIILIISGMLVFSIIAYFVLVIAMALLANTMPNATYIGQDGIKYLTPPYSSAALLLPFAIILGCWVFGGIIFAIILATKKTNPTENTSPALTAPAPVESATVPTNRTPSPAQTSEPHIVPPAQTSASDQAPPSASPHPSLPIIPNTAQQAAIRCIRCGSNTVSVQVVTETIVKRKHHTVPWWIFVGWWWIPFKWVYLTIPAIIMKVCATKTKVIHRQISVCVCQNCGCNWKLNK